MHYLHFAITALAGAVGGFGLGVWYCKPVRDELKALRDQAKSKFPKP